MQHEGDKLEREIARLEQKLLTPISSELRLEIMTTLQYLRARRNIWRRAS